MLKILKRKRECPHKCWGESAWSIIVSGHPTPIFAYCKLCHKAVLFTVYESWKFSWWKKFTHWLSGNHIYRLISSGGYSEKRNIVGRCDCGKWIKLESCDIETCEFDYEKFKKLIHNEVERMEIEKC
jgi:hypothetical protein